MTVPPAGISNRKDLRNLRNLPRSPLLSYLQRQVQPRAPRPNTAALAPAKHPLLAAFDPRLFWKWITEYFGHRLGLRHPFLSYTKSDPDQGVYKLEGDDDEIRIALAGDWATGTDEADRVAQLITAFDPHYSIHLGDVYYVGDDDEVDENFLGIKNPENEFAPCRWPTGSRGTFALNGNHEMYALGKAYFDRMLPTLGLNRDGVPLGQKASFFCLENEHWRIIALDTGYNSVGLPILEYIFRPDCAIRPEQLEWLRTVMPSKNDLHGVVVLSHHQYFSQYDSSYPKPARQLAEFVSGPVLWFWGHEHRLAIYNQFGVDDGVRAYGRCIGHGGMPVELPPSDQDNCQGIVEFIDKREYPNDENLTIGFNGFAQLSLRGNRMTVRYVDVGGTVIYSEVWVVNNGVLDRIEHNRPPNAQTGFVG